MTVISPMPETIVCPRCGGKIPPSIKICWHCGFNVSSIHERCPNCGKPTGHGRHRVEGRLVYLCGCGFASTTRIELERHLEEVS